MGVERVVETQYGTMETSDVERLDVLKQLVSTYYGIQKTRISIGNRVSAIVKEYGETETTSKLIEVFNESEIIEATALKHIKPLLREYRIYTDWLVEVRGIGPVLAAGFISGIKTPARFENISKLWKYCGLAVVNGRAEELRKGTQASYSPFLKVLCWKAGGSFVKAGGFYREVYEEFRSDEERKSEMGFTVKVKDSIGFIPYEEEYRKLIMKIFTCPNPECGFKANKYYSRCPVCGRKCQPVVTSDNIELLYDAGFTDKDEIKVSMTNAHIYARAKRKTVKLFLAHLWQVWREIEGLPVTKPYANTILGHENFIKPPYWKRGDV